MLGIGEKDRDGRQKRIEHRGRNLRVSRTGGVALREQIRAGGMTLTANTKHGLRVSGRVAKGTNVALQNGKLRLRGRYGKGPTKLNLSKSGISMSTRNAIGTFNWMKPNRSSVKLGGVQIRGKNAAAIQGVFAIFSVAFMLIQLTFVMIVFLVQMLWVMIQILVFALAWGVPRLLAGGSHLVQGIRALCASGQRARLKPAADGLHAQIKDSLAAFNSDELAGLLTNIITVGGRGQPIAMGMRDALAAISVESPDDRLRILSLAIIQVYRDKAGPEKLAATYLDVDEQCVQQGGRTRLQERLLADYAALNQLKLTPTYSSLQNLALA